APNGLQVEGKDSVKKIVTGVTASEALIDAAIVQGADAILVHHGYFWNGENPCLTGMKGRRIRKLIKHDISLLGYHLPLDAHHELGNNARLADLLGFVSEGVMDDQGVGNFGVMQSSCSLEDFSSLVEKVLGRKPLIISGGNHDIKRIAWCSGGAQKYLQQAALHGVDAYLSGEISENTVHEAREWGVHYISAGHHATERYGVQALGEHLAKKFDIEHEFIEIANPV
ncbi:MAG: Nif3-like dinuclear metal center hexameric protein, partial [Thiotrichaceae bacterium]